MSDKLPDLIDPLMLAERRAVFNGVINITALERLSDFVADSDGVVNVDAVFAKQGKRAVVSGSIKTQLKLECQSCLQDFPWSIDVHFKLAVVSSLQETDKLEIDAEPLLFDGEKLSFNSLIEDEILLALPDYPKHDYDCITRRSSQDRDYETQTTRSEADNPFSVLAKLKKTGE
jgi:uncharacterized protein